jgi:hypothetical protein
MKKIPVHQLIDKLTQMTEQFGNDVKHEFSELTEDQILWQPNDKVWSIAQCFAHLNAYFRYYIPVFNGKISNTRFKEPTETFTSSPLGIAVYRQVKLGKVKNVKRKLKSVKDYNPLINKSLSLKNVREEYLTHLDEMKSVLNASREINLRKTKCPLSLRPVVKLNLGDALIFIIYHNERHIEQIRKLTRLRSFPKA